MKEESLDFTLISVILIHIAQFLIKRENDLYLKFCMYYNVRTDTWSSVIFTKQHSAITDEGYCLLICFFIVYDACSRPHWHHCNLQSLLMTVFENMKQKTWMYSQLHQQMLICWQDEIMNNYRNFFLKLLSGRQYHFLAKILLHFISKGFSFREST